MLSFYPRNTVLQHRFHSFCGQHYGVLESQILTTAQGRFTPKIDVCTSRMPAYHKVLIGDQVEMDYHLSGYGTQLEESMIRLLGEGIERYAVVTADDFYRDSFIKASWNEMKNSYNVMPWEYVLFYSPSDYERLSTCTRITPIDKDTSISWVPCNSLFRPNEYIYVPAQLLFTGTRGTFDEPMFAPGFSKGSAAHIDFKHALKAALMESIEADSFTVGWYAKTRAREVIVDDSELLRVISRMVGDTNSKPFVFEYTLPDVPGYSFGVALLSNSGERPAVVVGCQTDLDARKAVYKALLEALAIYYMAMNGPIVSPELYMRKVVNGEYNNLDSNVAMWADEENALEKQNFFKKWCKEKVLLSTLETQETGLVDDDLAYILRRLKGVSRYGVYLDVTPAEVMHRGWSVVRTFIPELVQMCLPAFPYSNHPRIKHFGGVNNVLPHPVP